MKKCVLIYDDDPGILEVCKIILEQENYKVTTRMLSDTVIKDIIMLKPDLILMDLWIPEIGGENAIRLIKENEVSKHIPVILFSANAEIEKICKRADADGFIKKPFDVTNFINTVTKALA